MRTAQLIVFVFLLTGLLTVYSFSARQAWQSKYVRLNKNGKLEYKADEKGNIIPDFSRVGYYGGDKKIPDVATTIVISPSENAFDNIQAAIKELSEKQPDNNGFRGAILLKKGDYKIPFSIWIEASGIVLRGEGDEADGTRLIATTKSKDPLVRVSGKGNVNEITGTRQKITDDLLPTGSFSFHVEDAKMFKAGDRIIVYRPGTTEWIHDLKMDQIVEKQGTRQWKASEYNLQYERIITKIEKNRIFIDNPLVMPIESAYGGGEIFKYSFDGRINQVGIENILFESEYESDTAENHSWDAIRFDKIEHGWVRNVTGRYFAFSLVNLESGAKNISVLDSKCTDHKSLITGSRRYSFNNNGQLNLFMNCHTADGRHAFATGAKTSGPNVFVNCTAIRTHADIGPHHRWSSGTLYDNIITDGDINIQDRGNYGSGHGWVGTTQVVWNSKAKRAAVQSPYISGKNYCIGLKGAKYDGRLPGRPDGEWEGLNEDGLEPASLYEAQLRSRRN